MDVTGAPAVERVRPPKAPQVVSGLMCWLLSTPRGARGLGRHLLLMHVTGRVSGRRLTFPVSYRTADDGRLLVLTGSRWRVNLRGRPQVEVTLMGDRRPADAELVEDPTTVAEVYERLIAEVGPAKAVRRLGLRVTVSRMPTRTELEEAARRDGLALVYLDVQAGR